MKTTLTHTCMHACRILAAAALLSGCCGVELQDLAPGGAGNAGNGTPATFSIRLGEISGNNTGENEIPVTRSGEPLLSEWVKVNTFSVTRAAEDTEGPKLAAMELFEDAVSDTASNTAADASDTPRTRGVMPAGYTFRVIAFWKNGNQYEYQSVADYTSNGSATPELVRGEMTLSVGQTYRFVAYSFNNNVDMGVPPSDYAWNGTSIAIPDLTNDFMTYDSGDKTVSGEAFTLSVSFKQQLCKLTVKISVTGFSSNTFSNCAGVYVKQGGTSSSWTVGATGIAANTNNTSIFSIPNNSTATVRLVPFDAARSITVHFGTLTVGDRAANNTELTSSQSVKLLPGKSYTMTVQFEKKPGINVPAGEISGWNCQNADKTLLSKLVWAEGNLRQQNDNGSGPTIMAGPTDWGHYYTWNSVWTGNISQRGEDPCKGLDAGKYGSGWRTPYKEEMEALSRCTNSTLTNDGMWFMNSSKGLFLPAAGDRDSFDEGSGTTPTGHPGTNGYYWSSGPNGSNYGYGLGFFSGAAGVSSYNRTSGFPVRCVKEL